MTSGRPRMSYLPNITHSVDAVFKFVSFALSKEGTAALKKSKGQNRWRHAVSSPDSL